MPPNKLAFRGLRGQVRFDIFNTLFDIFTAQCEATSMGTKCVRDAENIDDCRNAEAIYKYLGFPATGSNFHSADL